MGLQMDVIETRSEYIRVSRFCVVQMEIKVLANKHSPTWFQDLHLQDVISLLRKPIIKMGEFNLQQKHASTKTLPKACDQKPVMVKGRRLKLTYLLKRRNLNQRCLVPAVRHLWTPHKNTAHYDSCTLSKMKMVVYACPYQPQSSPSPQQCGKSGSTVNQGVSNYFAVDADTATKAKSTEDKHATLRQIVSKTKSKQHLAKLKKHKERVGDASGKESLTSTASAEKCAPERTVVSPLKDSAPEECGNLMDSDSPGHRIQESIIIKVTSDYGKDSASSIGFISEVCVDKDCSSNIFDRPTVSPTKKTKSRIKLLDRGLSGNIPYEEAHPEKDVLDAVTAQSSDCSTSADRQCSNHYYRGEVKETAATYTSPKLKLSFQSTSHSSVKTAGKNNCQEANSSGENESANHTASGEQEKGPKLKFSFKRTSQHSVKIANKNNCQIASSGGESNSTNHTASGKQEGPKLKFSLKRTSQHSVQNADQDICQGVSSRGEHNHKTSWAQEVGQGTTGCQKESKRSGNKCFENDSLSVCSASEHVFKAPALRIPRKMQSNAASRQSRSLSSEDDDTDDMHSSSSRSSAVPKCHGHSKRFQERHKKFAALMVDSEDSESSGMPQRRRHQRCAPGRKELRSKILRKVRRASSIGFKKKRDVPSVSDFEEESDGSPLPVFNGVGHKLTKSFADSDSQKVRGDIDDDDDDDDLPAFLPGVNNGDSGASCSDNLPYAWDDMDMDMKLPSNDVEDCDISEKNGASYRTKCREDVLTSTVLPPIQIDDDSQEEEEDMMKKIRQTRNVSDLSNEQLGYLLDKSSAYFRGIFEGKMNCRRHEDYKKGGSSRNDLNYQVPLGLYQEGQQDAVMEALMHMFCRHHHKYLDYVMKVILAEALIKIYMELHCTTHEETEEIMTEALSKPGAIFH